MFVRFLLLLVASAVWAHPRPNPRKALPKFIINLDTAPEHRWDEVVGHRKLYIKVIVAELKDYFLDKKKEVAALVAAFNMTEEYRLELKGIARVLCVPYEDVVMTNLFYEIDGLGEPGMLTQRSCTSIVAQRANGSVYLARNQDYPTAFSPLMVHLFFQRNGITLYQGTGYAGTIGLDTGLVPGGWGASINARLGTGEIDTLQQAVARAANGDAVFPIIMRLAMDAGVSTFSGAVTFLSETKLITPGYIIIAGVKPGEGVVLSRNSTGGDAFYIDRGYPSNARKRFFLVQTNTDHWQPAPFYPGYNVSRRGTAIAGVTRLTRWGVSMLGMYDVLSTPPTFNPTTIHTNMMDPLTGEHYAYKRHGLFGSEKNLTAQM